MNTKKLTVAITTTALAVSVPLAAVCPVTALAAGHQSARPAVELFARSAATARLSGLPFGGAASYDLPTGQPKSAEVVFGLERAARADATSRLSGLPFGGAL